MKRVNFCKECGERVIDGDYCPVCGKKINNEEVKKMEKSRRTRKILLVILAIAIIAGVLIVSGAYNSNNNKTFVKHNFSDTCSVELPKWIKFSDGAGNINSNSNIAGSNVQSTTKALFGNNQVMQITYGKSTVDGSAVGADLNDAINVNIGNKKIYTRTVMSAETGEFVTVMGENETLINYIADHTLFNGKHGSNNTNKTVNDTSTGNQQNSGNTANNKNINTDKPANMDEQTYKAIIDTYGSYANYQKALDKQAEERAYHSDGAYNSANDYPTASVDTGGSGSGGKAVSTAEK